MPPSLCQVWWGTPAHACPRHVELLDANERNRLEQLRMPLDRARFTVGAALLRLTVARSLGCPPLTLPIDRTCPDCPLPHGKPRVPGSNLEVSVSHSGERVLVALTSAGATGVDVERVDTSLSVRDMLDQVLSWTELNDSDWAPQSSLAFSRVWTRKESVLKATGEGLRRPMSSFSLVPHGQATISDQGPWRVLAEDRLPPLVVHDLDVGAHHTAAVAVLSETPVRVRLQPAAGLLAMGTT